MALMGPFADGAYLQRESHPCTDLFQLARHDRMWARDVLVDATTVLTERPPEVPPDERS